jgi:hypothetical protein
MRDIIAWLIMSPYYILSGPNPVPVVVFRIWVMVLSSFIAGFILATLIR